MNEGSLNKRLHQRWIRFREIPGFEGCIVLRAPRTPDRNGHPDFLLIQPGREPKLGIVECEAKRGGLKRGPVQLKSFVRSFRKSSGNGARLFCESIFSAFDTSKERGRRNVNANPGGIEKWLRMARPRINGVGDLVEVLGRIRKRHFIPILILYPGTRVSESARRDAMRDFESKSAFVRTISGDGRWLPAGKED